MENAANKFSLDDLIIDIEWCSTHGHKVPHGRQYRILIDNHPYIAHKECMTGAEILSLTGKTPPNRFQLRQKTKHHGPITIPNDKVVCFTEPGIEKFKTLPMDQTDGEIFHKEEEKSPARRAFSLLEEDEEYLNSLGLFWETIMEPSGQWVLIHGYPIRDGYNVDKATLAVRMTTSYPTAQLDMVYFYPKLVRKDGKMTNALTDFPLDGKTYQQWSRHRTPQNPWRIGIDNLSTHVPLADIWLDQEFQKQPAV